MNNWRDYVGFQPMANPDGHNPDAFSGKIYYLVAEPNDETEEVRCLTLKVATHIVTKDQFTLTEDQIGDAVEATLYQFPEVEIQPFDPRNLKWTIRLRAWWKGYTIQSPYINREKTYVAMKTRRGAANTNFKDVWYYAGRESSNNKIKVIDVPIIVSSYQGKYMIFTHPQFDKYGFRMKIKEKT